MMTIDFKQLEVLVTVIIGGSGLGYLISSPE